jgi:hypothetical protein
MRRRMSIAAGKETEQEAENLATAEMDGTTAMAASARAAAAIEIRHRLHRAAGTEIEMALRQGSEIANEIAVGRMTTVVRSVGRRAMEAASPAATEVDEKGVIRVRLFELGAQGAAAEGRHHCAVAAVGEKAAVPRWIATEATETEESGMHVVAGTGVMSRTAAAAEEPEPGTEIPKAVVLRGGRVVAALHGPTVGPAAHGLMRVTALCV